MKSVSKGEKISLNKESLSNQYIININYECPPEYNLDSSVLMLSQRNKLEEESDFIFYNNPISSCSSVAISEAQGIKKRITIDTDKIPANISRLMFVTTIDNGDKLSQHFSQVNNIHIELSDNQTKIIDYQVNGLTKETALILIEIYKHNDEWKLQATGNGFNSGLDAILKEYGSEKVQVNEANDLEPEAKIEVKAAPIPETATQNKETINFNKTPSGTIDFVKKHNERIDLVKKQIQVMGLPNVKANVVIVMDISGSMHSLFKKGIIQDTFDRVLPLAMQFDDDGIIDVWLFDSKCIHSETPYTLKNREDYVKKEITSKHQLGGGTEYCKPIEGIEAEQANNKNITYVLFFTDGNCSDAAKTKKAMIEVSTKPIFWKFIGLGGNKPADKEQIQNQGFFSKKITVRSTGFDFLETLDDMAGRIIDNADFFQIYDIHQMTDEELYKGLLEEFPKWISDAKTKNIL